jgi:hypothetical protein
MNGYHLPIALYVACELDWSFEAQLIIKFMTLQCPADGRDAEVIRSSGQFLEFSNVVIDEEHIVCTTAWQACHLVVSASIQPPKDW